MLKFNQVSTVLQSGFYSNKFKVNWNSMFWNIDIYIIIL